MSWGAIFGVFVFVAMLCVLASGDHVKQKIWLLLAIDWASNNVAVTYLGFEPAMLVIPSVNALIALFVAILGFAHRSRSAMVVFLLYLAMGVAHVAFFLLRLDGGYWHYFSVNSLFFLMLVSLGGAGAWMAVRHRSAGRHPRARPDTPRGAGVEGT